MTRLLFATVFLSVMSAVCLAQDINTLKSGVVRIRNTYSQDGGTGFIIKIDGERAYIITASHIVKNNEHPSVYLYNRPSEPVQATLTYREDDEQKGLALLEIKAKKETFSNLTPVGLRGSSDLKGGEQVHVIGFPNGAIIWSVSLETSHALKGGTWFSPHPLELAIQEVLSFMTVSLWVSLQMQIQVRSMPLDRKGSLNILADLTLDLQSQLNRAYQRKGKFPMINQSSAEL